MAAQHNPSLDLNRFRFDFLCPDCGKAISKSVGELAGKGNIACPNCGSVIDFTNKQWQTGLHQMIEGLSDIYRRQGS